MTTKDPNYRGVSATSQNVRNTGPNQPNAYDATKPQTNLNRPNDRNPGSPYSSNNPFDHSVGVADPAFPDPKDPNNPALAITPATISLRPSATQQFSCNVVGTKWSVLPGGSGSINDHGLYTAPPKTGVDTVVATAPNGNVAKASVTIS